MTLATDGVAASPWDFRDDVVRSPFRVLNLSLIVLFLQDLKKQTALRLAQEQSRQNNRGGPTNTPKATSSASGYHAHPVVSAPAPTRATRTNAPPSRPSTVRPNPPSSTPYLYSQQRIPPPPSYGPEAPPPPAAVDPYSYERSSGVGHGGARSVLVHSNQFSTDPSLATIPNVNNKSQQKSKLPHGLTVQELKEMTKARLQAEAASKNGSAPRRHAPSPGVELGGSVGRTLSESPVAPPPRVQQPPVVRSVSPALAGFRPRNDSGWHSSDPRSENWETLSIGNGGSGPTAGGPPSDVYLMPPSSSNYSSELKESRRRATTMSPMMDPEVRERTFSEASGTGVLPPRDRAFSSDTMFSQSQALPSAVGRERAFSSDVLPPSSSLLPQRSVVSSRGNRARTSSATSLPPMSQTADEFGIDRFASNFGAVREDAPLTTTPGLADVFRVSSFDQEEPALLAPLESTAADHRMRASTWSEGESLFGDFADDLASILKLSGAEDSSQFLSRT